MGFESLKLHILHDIARAHNVPISSRKANQIKKLRTYCRVIGCDREHVCHRRKLLANRACFHATVEEMPDMTSEMPDTARVTAVVQPKSVQLTPKSGIVASLRKKLKQDGAEAQLCYNAFWGQICLSKLSLRVFLYIYDFIVEKIVMVGAQLGKVPDKLKQGLKHLIGDTAYNVLSTISTMATKAIKAMAKAGKFVAGKLLTTLKRGISFTRNLLGSTAEMSRATDALMNIYNIVKNNVHIIEYGLAIALGIQRKVCRRLRELFGRKDTVLLQFSATDTELAARNNPEVLLAGFKQALGLASESIVSNLGKLVTTSAVFAGPVGSALVGGWSFLSGYLEESLLGLTETWSLWSSFDMIRQLLTTCHQSQTRITNEIRAATNVPPGDKLVLTWKRKKLNGTLPLLMKIFPDRDVRQAARSSWNLFAAIRKAYNNGSERVVELANGVGYVLTEADREQYAEYTAKQELLKEGTTNETAVEQRKVAILNRIVALNGRRVQ
jgi:hypothetical protein